MKLYKQSKNDEIFQRIQGDIDHELKMDKDLSYHQALKMAARRNKFSIVAVCDDWRRDDSDEQEENKPGKDVWGILANKAIMPLC